MSHDPIQSRLNSGVLEISLNRPTEGNKITEEMGAQLVALLGNLSSECKLVLLRSNGEDFCTGRQSPQFDRSKATAVQFREIVAEGPLRLYRALRECRAPIVGVLQGKVHGVGCAIAALCDLAVAALLGGHVDFAMLPYTLANPHLQSGKLKALAVTLDARLALLPDVPTFLESGIKDVTVTTGFGVRVPKNTPPEVISKLNNAFNAALRDSKVQQTLRSSGIIAVGGPPSRLDAYLNEETVRWLKTIPPQARID